jgi:hypothetical protein
MILIYTYILFVEFEPLKQTGRKMNILIFIMMTSLIELSIY